MEAGQLVDEAPDEHLEVGVVGSWEPGLGVDQVLEHHHVAGALHRGVPHVRNPNRHAGGDVAIEASLGDAEADRVDKAALTFVERGELHEHRSRLALVALVAHREARPPGRSRMGREHLDCSYRRGERRREPRGGDVGDLDRHLNRRAGQRDTAKMLAVRPWDRLDTRRG